MHDSFKPPSWSPASSLKLSESSLVRLAADYGLTLFQIIDRSLEVMGIGWPDLEELNISHCVSVTDKGIGLLARRMSKLKTLNIDGINFISDT